MQVHQLMDSEGPSARLTYIDLEEGRIEEQEETEDNPWNSSIFEDMHLDEV